MKLTKTCARFLRKHGGTILAVAASVGVVATAIETGKATIKAEKLVELNKDVPEYGMKEKVKDCWQFYIPAAVLGAGTIGCIIGSNMLSRKEIASLSAAYVALGKSYQQYRRQVAERIGVEEEEKLRMLKNGIRPIFNDADLFTIKVQVATTGLSKVEDKYKAFIKQVIRSRKEYRGSGTPTMFTTEDALTEIRMIKKVIPYTDFDGNPRVEEFWFNLTKAEMMDLGLSKDGGYDKYMEQLMHSTKVGEAIEVFKKILLLAYGKKSLDGRKFEKSPEITADFVATQAYSDLYVELASDPDKAAEFMNGVMGADVRKMVAENEAKAKAAEVSAAVAANNAPALAVADPQ